MLCPVTDRTDHARDRVAGLARQVARAVRLVTLAVAGVGLVFGGAVWVAAEHAEAVSRAPVAGVVGLVVGLVPATLLVLALRTLEATLSTLGPSRLRELADRSTTGKVAGLARMARDASGLRAVPVLLSSGLAASALLVAVTPIAVGIALLAIVL